MAAPTGKTVLVVGGTGALGQRVVRAVLQRGHAVRALVRPGSDASKLEAHGSAVTVVRGDMNKPETLGAAFAGADAVVTTANGYMAHKRGDTISTDLVGNRNLVDAAAAAKTPVFVFLSILTCDQARAVPHFDAKRVIEEYIAAKGVPAVILRPGAFLDASYYKKDLAGNRISALFDRKVPITYIHPDDVAHAVAAAVDEPRAVGQKIDLGAAEPASIEKVAEVLTTLIGRPIAVRTVPHAILWCVSWFSPFMADMLAMFNYFNTGKYVADIKLATELFGPVPTLEESLRKVLAECDIEAKPASSAASSS